MRILLTIFQMDNKGDWDKSKGYEDDYQFDKAWIAACRNKLKSNGTIWISGTYHNIFLVARCLTELGFKILNCITWEKTNPPPNLSCKYFTYSAEYILWARKEPKVSHFFNYNLMKKINGGTQMRDVWRLPHGKSRVGNILRKNHCVCFPVSFKLQPFPEHGF